MKKKLKKWWLSFSSSGCEHHPGENKGVFMTEAHNKEEAINKAIEKGMSLDPSDDILAIEVKTPEVEEEWGRFEKDRIYSREEMTQQHGYETIRVEAKE